MWNVASGGEHNESDPFRYSMSHNTTPSQNVSDAQFTLWQSALIGIFLSAIIVISILGNILVCVAILTDRKLKKVSSNLFLISLAISDLVVSSLVMPFAVANDILGFWPFAFDFCNIWISLDILSATASILNLCAISLDRYIHMRKPFEYEAWMSKPKCLGFIAGIWIASILISFLPINLGWHELPSIDSSGSTEQMPIIYANESLTLTRSAMDTIIPHTTHSTADAGIAGREKESTDAPSQCYLKLHIIYAIFSSSISFYLPCIVMVAIYIKMYNFARDHAKCIKQSQAIGGKSKITENKALFTLGMIMGLFLLSWIPFFIVNLVKSLCSSCVSTKLFVAFTWLGYFNSTMNPIIYSKFNADFRAAFKRILCCQKCRTRDPYDFKTRSRSPSNVALKRLNANGATENGKYNNGTLPQNGCVNGQSECKELPESHSLIDKDQSDSQSLIEKEDINENVIESNV